MKYYTGVYIIGTLLLSSLAPAAPELPQSKRWPLVAYRAPKKVKKPQASAEGKFSSKPSTSGHGKGGLAHISADPAKDPNGYDPGIAAYHPARKLLEEGKVDQAIRYLEGVRNANPGGIIFDSADCLLTDAYLMQKKPEIAFAVMQRWLAPEEELMDTDGIVRASVAAALMGRNYPGQEDFVTRYFRANCTNFTLPDIKDPQKRLIYISAAAATLDGEYNAKRILYALIALDAVPGDPFATMMAADTYVARGDKDAARKLLEKVKSSPDKNLNSLIDYWKVGVGMKK